MYLATDLKGLGFKDFGVRRNSEILVSGSM